MITEFGHEYSWRSLYFSWNFISKWGSGYHICFMQTMICLSGNGQVSIFITLLEFPDVFISHLGSRLISRKVKYSESVLIRMKMELLLNFSIVKHLHSYSPIWDYRWVPICHSIKFGILILKRFQCKLSSWKANTLSFEGRTTLINLVVGSLPNFYFSMFKEPLKVIEDLETVRRESSYGVDVTS